MTRSPTVHRCASCDATTPRWAGRCPSCGEWNTLAEVVNRPAPSQGWRTLGASGTDGSAGPIPLAQVDPATGWPRPTGLAEFDRVLAGGFVPGSVTLLGGEPGIGKSTLLHQVLLAVATDGGPVLLASAEESAQQVRRRAERFGSLPEDLLILAGTDIAAVVAAVEQCRPKLVVVDSIQAVADVEASGVPGSVSQVRACADRMLQVAKERDVAVVMVGHVTKDGTLAGPRLLEHLVDTVLTFEGDRHHALRILRAVKHRFGPTGELGLFEMGESGLDAVSDPGRLLLGDRRPGVAGDVVLPAMQGRRSLLVELQALVAPSPAQNCRRSAQGIDAGRLGMVLAVLENRVGIRLSGADVYASVAGGLRVSEPSADLAIALAVASAALGVPIPDDTVVCGEIGLGGEIRQVPNLPRRLAEAARLGFRRAMVPESSPDCPREIPLLRVATLAEAVDAACGALAATGGSPFASPLSGGPEGLGASVPTTMHV